MPHGNFVLSSATRIAARTLVNLFFKPALAIRDLSRALLLVGFGLVLVGFGLVALAGAILLKTFADHPAILTGLFYFVCFCAMIGIAFVLALMAIAVVDAVKSGVRRGRRKIRHFATTDIPNIAAKMRSHLRGMVTAVKKGSEWSWKQVKRLDPNLYLDTGWKEVSLLLLGIGVCIVFIKFLRQEQYFYVATQYMAQHHARISDYHVPKGQWVFLFSDIFVVGYSVKRLFQRLEYQIWEWQDRRRIKTVVMRSPRIDETSKKKWLTR
jgi:hypothetical protein